MTLDELIRRMTDRATTYVVPMYDPDGRVIVTDGVAMLCLDRAWGTGQELAAQRVLDIAREKPKRRQAVKMRPLRDWCGPAPVLTVEPCPSWLEHEEDPDGGECWHGCIFVPGLGFAFESQDRPFATAVNSDAWGDVAGVVVDRVRLAELLAPFDDDFVWVGKVLRGQALRVSGVSWEATLMGRVRRKNCGTVASARTKQTARFQ